MRIAVVHSYYSSAVPSGENNVVRDQVALLRDSGHDVLEVSRSTDEESTQPGYAARSALRVMTGRGASPSEELERFSPDVVHLHNTFPNWGTSWLEAWGGRTVATLHNYRTVCANGLLFRDGHPCRDCVGTPVLPAVRHRCYRDSAVATLPVAVGASPAGGLRRIARRAARVVALNPQAQATLADALGREVELVPNFVTRPAGTPTERGDRWAYVGRLSAEKGVLELLHSWPDDHPLDVIGSGPLAAEVATTIAGRANIRLRAPLARTDLLAEMAGLRGVVIPSMCTEGLPTVALEAVAAGTPLLLSHHVSAASEMSAAGAALVIDPQGGAAAMASALRDVVADWPARSADARRLYEADYAPETWLARMEAVYRTL